MKKRLCKVLIGIVGLLFLNSCVSIRPYERVYVNDPEMEMGIDTGKGFDNYVYSIREGATPAGTNTDSGGCGCR